MGEQVPCANEEVEQMLICTKQELKVVLTYLSEEEEHRFQTINVLMKAFTHMCEALRQASDDILEAIDSQPPKSMVPLKYHGVGVNWDKINTLNELYEALESKPTYISIA